jgi:hypothetical protein
MNEITLSEDRFADSTLISQPGLEIELRQIGSITFGLVTRSDGTPRFAFASAELAAYLAKRKDKRIIDVKLMQQTPIWGEEIDETKILRLKFSDARIITLDKYDHLYEFEPILSREISHALISPHKQWGLPPLSFAGLMLLTERMVSIIEDLADEGQHAYLIKILWDDYRLAIDESGANEFDQINIEGEFMDFSVKRFAHGLFIFDNA